MGKRPLSGHEDRVVDRVPDRGKRRQHREVGLLHLDTIEWAEGSMRKLLTELEAELTREGRVEAAATTAFILKKIQGLYLREYETQRKRLNRATRRDREKLDRELVMLKQRARQTQDLLDSIEYAHKKIDELRRKASNASRGLRYHIEESVIEFTADEADDDGTDGDEAELARHGPDALERDP